jgi:23S rRNA pseudouridine2605 synthase
MKTKRGLIQVPNQRSPSRVSLARALSKMGYCSRAQARAFIEAGRVKVNGAIQRQIEFRLDPNHDRMEVDGKRVTSPVRIYLMLNKPRGVVTTRADEQERKTVYDCLADRDFPWLFPVGRLDQASEGMLLLTNDTRWAAGITDPGHHVDKTYHVQIEAVASADMLAGMQAGIRTGDGDLLRFKQAKLLRPGPRNSWLEIVLDEGQNRQIRRLLAALGLKVLRLVRVAIGPVPLGDLPKGSYRQLTPQEQRSLAQGPKRKKAISSSTPRD